ncbi:hypothetical protein BSKO_02569 [Bryopsis sp. KO-2023]|nr:hypothetical protein BSKO_02569 [Bryopsis sp. KO-2023]
MMRTTLSSWVFVGILVTLTGERFRNANAARVVGTGFFEASSDHRKTDRHLSQEVVALIQGGQNAQRGRFPYVTSLRDLEDAHTCGGVLIYETWVLTAAHCVDPGANVDGKPLGLNPQLAIGALKLSDDGNTPGVEVVLGEVFLHESWDGDLLNGFDIALVKLPERSSLTPIRLAARGAEFVTGQPFVAVGWGSQGNGRSSPDNLKWANVIHRDNEKCNLEGVWNASIVPQMLCAGGTIGDTADICKGDSGGPLILAHAPAGKEENGNPDLDLLVGLVSFGELPGCDSGEPFDFRKPIVYTRISEFRDWIDETIGVQIPDEPTPAAEQEEDETETGTVTETPTPTSPSTPETSNAAQPLSAATVSSQTLDGDATAPVSSNKTPSPAPKPDSMRRPEPRPQPKPKPQGSNRNRGK